MGFSYVVHVVETGDADKPVDRWIGPADSDEACAQVFAHWGAAGVQLVEMHALEQPGTVPAQRVRDPFGTVRWRRT
ncbi:MAG: hypothetical protein ACRDYU_03840 [Actinomycetes bacterium]